MTLKTSSFTAQTGAFDTCIRLFLDAEGEDIETLVPIGKIARIGSLDKNFSLITFDDGTAQNVALTLDALLARLRTVALDSGIIDLTKETSGDMLLDAPRDNLSRIFNEQCTGRHGRDYLELRCYAAHYGKPDQPFELLLRYEESDVRAEPRDKHLTTRTYLAFRQHGKDSLQVEIRIPYEDFKRQINNARSRKQSTLDLREVTRREFGAITLPPVLKP